MEIKKPVTFPQAQERVKILTVVMAVLVIAGVFFTQDGSTLQMILMVLIVVAFILTIVTLRNYCVCPYCKKHIISGVLVVKTCPKCHRNLITGKKSGKKSL